MLSLGSKSHPTPRTARRTNASLKKQMDSEPTSVSHRRNEPPKAGGAAESSRAAVKPPTQRLAPRLCCALNGKTAQRETIPSSTRLAHTARRPKPRKAALIVSGAIKRPQPHEIAATVTGSEASHQLRPHGLHCQTSAGCRRHACTPWQSRHS